MIGGKPDMILVRKNTYEGLSSELEKIKTERLRNKQFTDKLNKNLKILNYEKRRVSGMLYELVSRIYNLDEYVEGIEDNFLKEKLSKMVEYLKYETMEMETVISKLRKIIDTIEEDLKEYEELR